VHVYCIRVFLPRDALVSAKRGLAIACRLSVCLSQRWWIVNCDHIGWNSSEIISPLVSLGCSLSADPNIRGLLQGERPEILVQNDPPRVDLRAYNVVFSMFVCYSAAFCQLCFYNKDWIGLDWIG